jgi:hypothetical protein
LEITYFSAIHQPVVKFTQQIKDRRYNDATERGERADGRESTQNHPLLERGNYIPEPLLNTRTIFCTNAKNLQAATDLLQWHRIMLTARWRWWSYSKMFLEMVEVKLPKTSGIRRTPSRAVTSPFRY